MTVTDKKEIMRYCAICEIEESQMIDVVKMDAYPDLGDGCFKKIRDEDGDAIIASCDIAFDEPRAGSLVQTTFPVGTAPALVARTLRKYAQMLDSQRGHEIANLGKPGTPYQARRLKDGTVWSSEIRDEE
jgi:hypothetical protein